MNNQIYFLILAMVVASSTAQSTILIDQWCAEADQSGCVSCIDGYYLVMPSRSCQQVSQYCNTYDPATGYCTSCKDQYVLGSDGRCTQPTTTTPTMMPNCAKMDTTGQICI